ncbi:MAG TPA: PIN domain-containing protein [Candidatus Angelobacter sp.]|jgi:predicted nucleic acid-binding protein|nr:PIN domain-containing protein [Candidatus Angelobacter sp.]
MNVTTPVVVDTDVISYLFKNHSLAQAYQALLAGRPLAVSLISLAEIEYWMDTRNWGNARRDLMHRFLTRFTPLMPGFETAVLWARIKSNCEKKGRPITFADAWIAAAALQLNVPLATHNASDYVAIDGLKVLTAWQSFSGFK